MPKIIYGKMEKQYSKLWKLYRTCNDVFKDSLNFLDAINRNQRAHLVKNPLNSHRKLFGFHLLQLFNFRIQIPFGQGSSFEMFKVAFFSGFIFLRNFSQNSFQSHSFLLLNLKSLNFKDKKRKIDEKNGEKKNYVNDKKKKTKKIDKRI